MTMLTMLLHGDHAAGYCRTWLAVILVAAYHVAGGWVNWVRCRSLRVHGYKLLVQSKMGDWEGTGSCGWSCSWGLRLS